MKINHLNVRITLHSIPRSHVHTIFWSAVGNNFKIRGGCGDENDYTVVWSFLTHAHIHISRTVNPGSGSYGQPHQHSYKFSPGAATPKRPRLNYGTGGGKDRELRHKSEPSLWGGGWGDNLISCVRFNEERNKQDKTGLFILNL